MKVDREYAKMVGERLKYAAKRKKQTQYMLADYLGYSVCVLRKIYQGARMLTASEADNLAQYLGVRTEWLLCKDNDMTKAERDKRLLEELEARDNAKFGRLARREILLSTIMHSWLREVCLDDGFGVTDIRSDQDGNIVAYRIDTPIAKNVDVSREELETWYSDSKRFAAYMLERMVARKGLHL